jgi:hypothetical protein
MIVATRAQETKSGFPPDPDPPLGFAIEIQQPDKVDARRL